MTRSEALLILGLQNNENKLVLSAYKNMMQNNHPDHGGSAYLARKINEARDTLVKRK